MEDYYTLSPAQIAEQRAENEQYQRQRAFIERFAECWRVIGQPDTSHLSVVVAVDSDEWMDAPFEVLGMSVFEIGTPINGQNVAIVTSHDCWSDVPLDFENAWKRKHT